MTKEHNSRRDFIKKSMHAGCFGCITLGTEGITSDRKNSKKEARRLDMKKNWVRGATNYGLKVCLI